MVLQEQWQAGAGKLAAGQPVVPVVIDPFLARQLRPHQKEGVAFMYQVRLAACSAVACSHRMLAAAAAQDTDIVACLRSA